MVQELSLVIPFPVIRPCCLGNMLTANHIFQAPSSMTL